MCDHEQTFKMSHSIVSSPMFFITLKCDIVWILSDTIVRFECTYHGIYQKIQIQETYTQYDDTKISVTDVRAKLRHIGIF